MEVKDEGAVDVSCRPLYPDLKYAIDWGRNLVHGLPHLPPSSCAFQIVVL